MPAEIRVPELGESIYEVTVQRWLRREGESVAEGDPLVELETEKANVEIPAERAGVLTSISRREGETVQVGDVLGAIGEPAGAGAPAETKPAAGEPAPAAARGAGNGSASRTADTPGAGSVSTGDEAAGTDHAAASPAVRRLAAEHDLELSAIRGTGPRGRVLREDVLALVNSADRQIPGTESQTGMSAPPSAASPGGTRPEPESTAPLADPLSAGQTEIPVPSAAPSPGQQTGTSASSPTAQTDIPASPPGPSPLGQTFLSAGGTEPDAGRRERRVRMTPRRRIIARRLVEAQQTAAMLTTFNEADMTAVMTLRKRRNEDFTKRHGARLGFMSFFAKAVVGALKEFPYLNAEIQGEEIVLKEYYDIGIAVGMAEGLVVPVVRDADRKTFAQLEREIADLAARARENRLGLADLQGGTFTITNGGVYGSLMSTPILNAPQVGILGMHAIKERPVVVEGEIAIRPMMYLALSYDHRIVDGSDAVRFLVRIKELVEDPETLLLEG